MIDVRLEPADSRVAVALVARYLAELDSALPGGFDAAQSVPAEPEHLSPPHGLFVVAYDGDAAVGCGGLKLLAAGIAEMKRVWVDPAARGRGVGVALVSALEEQARGLGVGSLVLDTSAELIAGIALYRRLGYVETEPYNDNRFADLWFAKRLDVAAAP